jgi:hypothetical protein
MRNLEIAPSAVRLLFYYCGRADHDTGETNVSAQRASQDLGIRRDHIDENDRKLVREGFIKIVKDENGGRVVWLLAPWQPRAERNGQPAQRPAKKATSQDLGKTEEAQPQNLGSPLNSSSETNESSQNLGTDLKDFPDVGKPLPQNLGRSTQVLGKSPQNLGAHIGITSPCNQPMEPAQENTLGAHAPESRTDRSGKVNSSPEQKKPSRKKADPPKSRYHNHPSVVAYREILDFYTLNAAQADLIAEVTGKEIERAPPEWLKFLRELAETGNKYAHNVRVMVLAFAQYKNNVPLAEALNRAWNEARGRTSGDGGISNGKYDTPKTRDTRTTEELGIRTPRQI